MRCPCGYLGDAKHQCKCNPMQVEKYLGRISGPLPLGVEGVLDAALPTAISPTFFTNLGSIVFATMVLCCAAAAFLASRRRRPA